MDITPRVTQKQALITGYGAGAFSVNGTLHEQALLIYDGQIVPWPLESWDALTMESFTPLLTSASQPEVLIVGTGAGQHFIKMEIMQALKAKGITVEAMATGAACRTYNVLMAEGRRVAAALLPI